MPKFHHKEISVVGRFLLYHPRPQDFVVAIWQSNSEEVSHHYVIYRFILAALFLSILVANGSIYDSPNYFFIYLTNLGFVIQTLHLVISAALPVEHLFKNIQGSLDNQMTILAQVSWTLYNITNTLTVLIAVTYWAILFPPTGEKLKAMNFFVHGLIWIVSTSDILISLRPCRLLHFYQPVLFVAFYLIFTLIYWAAGGHDPKGFPYIYTMTNWANPTFSVPLAVLTVLIVVPLIHTFVWVLHQIRDWLLLRMKAITSIEPVGE